MDPEPSNYLNIIFSTNLIAFNDSLEILGLFLFLLVLIVSSALISGSENALFSLTPKDFEELEEHDNKAAEVINNIIGFREHTPQNGTLKKKEKSLLATILIANNFINIAIVIVSEYFIRLLLGQQILSRWGQYFIDVFAISKFTALQIGGMINFLITVVGVTFILVLFGEVLPKIYANVNSLKFSMFMSRPLSFLNKRFAFFAKILVNSTDTLEGALVKKMSDRSISKEHIDKAIELTVKKTIKNKDELDILKGIIKFNEVTAKEIMTPRVDITSIDQEISFVELLKIIRYSKYSRIPVFEEDFDNIVGILYVKDLIGKKDESNFEWQSIIRKDVMYTPETKKVNELLKEFQSKKVHMAIVVDEYGGSEGLITLEDIMEEIIGEISDEFDGNRSIDYVKISNSNYIFEGKTSLHDVAKVIQVDSDIFDDYKGEADSIAGLILEINGVLPKEQSEFMVEPLKLIINKVNERRIVKVQVKTSK